MAIIAWLLPFIAYIFYALAYGFYDFSDHISYLFGGIGLTGLIVSLILPLILYFAKKNDTTNKKLDGLMIGTIVLLILQVIMLLFRVPIINAVWESDFLYSVCFGFPGSALYFDFKDLLLGIFDIFSDIYYFGFFSTIFLFISRILYAVSCLIYFACTFVLIIILSEFCDMSKFGQVGVKIEMLRHKLYAAIEPIGNHNANLYVNEATVACDCAEGETDTVCENPTSETPVTSAPTNATNPLFEVKSIGLCVLFSLLTFGIYWLVWKYKLIKKIKLLNNDNSSSVGEFLLCTFVPFYIFYWYYTRATKIEIGARAYGIRISNNNIIYLVLSIFGLSIVCDALIQNDLNTIAGVFNSGRVVYDPNMKVETPSPLIVDEPVPVVTPSVAPTPIEPAKPTVSIVDQIREIASLRDAGILTEEEFQAKKTELLKRL